MSYKGNAPGNHFLRRQCRRLCADLKVSTHYEGRHGALYIHSYAPPGKAFACGAIVLRIKEQTDFKSWMTFLRHLEKGLIDSKPEEIFH